MISSTTREFDVEPGMKVFIALIDCAVDRQRVWQLRDGADKGIHRSCRTRVRLVLFC
jgi:hypothetical protein